MARGRQTLTQRISLDGGKEIREELEALGADGRRVFQRLSQAAEDTAEAGSRLNRFVADLRKRFEELREAGREVGRALNDVGREARTVSRRLTAAVAAAAGTATALAALAHSGASAADEASKTAQAYGLTVEELGRLTHAFRLSGLAANDTERAMNRLNEEIVRTRDGGAGADTVLSRLGITVSDGAGGMRLTEEILGDLADRFAAMPDGAEKSALAMELFGTRAGPRLIPLLNQGRAGIAALGAEAERLGLVITEEQAKIGTALVDAVATTRAAASAIRRDLGLLFAPAFTQAANALTEGIAENRDTLISLGERVRDHVVPVLRDLIALIEGREADIEAAWILQLRDGVELVISSLRTLFGIVATVFRAVEHAVQQVLDVINLIFGTELQARQVIMIALLGKVLGIFRLIGAAVQLVRVGFAALATVFGTVAARVAGIALAIQLVLGLVQQAIDALLEFAEGAIGQFVALFTGGADKAASSVEDMRERSVAATAAVGEAAAEAGATVAGEMTSAATQSEGAFSTAMAAIGSMFGSLGDQATSILQSILSLLRDIIATARRAFQAVTGVGGAEGRAEGGPVGFSGGGKVRGPGTATSDSILARLSTGEYVIRAAAVRKYGASLFAALNGMKIAGSQIRGFAGGGLVEGLSSVLRLPSLALTPQFAAAAGGASGRPLTLSIGGETFAGLIAPEDVAERLVRFATLSHSRSLGRKPSWYGG